MDSDLGSDVMEIETVKLTVSPAQAQMLVNAMQRVRQAQADADELLHVLTVGCVPAGSVLKDINTDTGMLTFSNGTI